MNQSMLDYPALTARLMSEENGIQDYDIEGHPTLHRACVPVGIKQGQRFNVYHGVSGKSGAVWKGDLLTSIRKFAIAGPAKQRFCIVSSNYTSLVAAWPGTKAENRKYLLNREVIAEVTAESSEEAMRIWRASLGSNQPSSVLA